MGGNERGEGGRMKEGGQKIGEERRDEKEDSHTSTPTEVKY